MKRSSALVIVISVLMTACASHQLQPGQLNVNVNEALVNDADQMAVITHYRVDKYLMQYLREFARKSKLRSSVKIDSEVSKFYFGKGRDFIGVDTIVTENGEEVGRFYLESSSIRKSSGKRLTARLASDILSKVKSMLSNKGRSLIPDASQESLDEN